MKASPQELRFLTFEEAERFLQATPAEWRSFVTLALKTGLRVGELLALKWEDVDLEFRLAPKLALIRQREVGRDTPSFDQALRDALREDTDVLVVGEVRDPEAMRLTLAAAETGHLVLTTLHSSTVGEALACRRGVPGGDPARRLRPVR